jgi:hypothetical protein
VTTIQIEVDEDLIDNGLRLLTAAVFEHEHTDTASGYGYGTTFENDTFMIHPFCWCDQPDCAWCAKCSCADSDFHYFIDDVEVDYDTYEEYYTANVGPALDDEFPWPGSPLEVRANAVNARRRTVHTPTCNWCLHPELRRANFEHRDSGTKVTWYKYIGRSMHCDLRAPWIQVITDCLVSLQTSS